MRGARPSDSCYVTKIRTCASLLAVSLMTGVLPARISTLTRDQLVKMTAENPYDRFPDGRPKVPDALFSSRRH